VLTPTAHHTQTSDPPGADAAGVHYPGIGGGNAALDFPMWSSEEASTYNNDVGGGCWARVVNQNYVANNMTASLCWNLVASYMKATNW
jgi:galactosylceramidase